MIEAELVDDYIFDLLTPEERALFESRFMTTPERLQMLLLSRLLYDHLARTQTTPAEP